MIMVSESNMRQLFAITSALLGGFIVFGSVILMNKQAIQNNDENDEIASVVSFTKKIPSQAKPKMTPRPQTKKVAKLAPNPLAGLEGSLAGLDFGLPQYDTGDEGLANFAAEQNTVMSDDTVDQAPRPIAQAPMPYPPSAKSQGITGYVLLSILVSPSGQVEKVKVLESEPQGVFDEVASAGVRTWRFEPATYKGEAVRVWATQRVRFDLG